MGGHIVCPRSIRDQIDRVRNALRRSERQVCGIRRVLYRPAIAVERTVPAGPSFETMSTLPAKLAVLEKCLRDHAPMLVAYSGGVDSTYLLAVAHQMLGHQVTGVIADSPSLPREALKRAISVANHLGINLEVIPTFELNDDNYASNPLNRCYFCKFELFQKMA